MCKCALFQVFCCSTTIERLYSHLFCRKFMFYWCYLYLFMYTGVQQDFHISWCSCRLTVTQQVSHVELEQLPFLEPEFTTVFLWGSFFSVFSFMCNDKKCVLDRSLSFCPFSFGRCVVCPSIYSFWLLPWYLQTFLMKCYSSL
jgi:hypothetical protein